MKIEKIKNRGTLFTYDNLPEWDLNIYLINGVKHNFIIDTGLGPISVIPILKEIEKDEKPIIIINTHYHWDHIWGNALFKDCTIISHTLCREMAEKNWDDMIMNNQEYLAGEVDICLPDLVFSDELYFPEDKIRIIYTPGHTIDSVSVIDEMDSVIHAGDNIGDTIDEIVPNLDCEKNVYIESLMKYKEVNAELFISGHNTVLKADVIDKILQQMMKLSEG